MAIIYGRSESEKELLGKYPKEVQNIEDIPRAHQEYKERVKRKETGFFGGIKQWNKQRQLDKFEKNKSSPFQAGARGELRVLDELSKLNDDYHIFCGVNIDMSNARYKGKFRKTAQIDFVVVSSRGVILIEVKNWSQTFANNNTGFSPYEQTERSGKILWMYLQGWFSGPRVTNVLLSVGTKLDYNPKYRSVFVSDLSRINYFIEHRDAILSEKDVKKIVGKLRGLVTKK